MNNVKRSQRRPVGQGGFTLTELIIVVAVISIVAALAVPLYANEEARARVAKAQAEVRTLACAVNLYTAHVGTLPFTLTNLTTAAVNRLNQSAGPFVPSLPPLPSGGTPAWSPVYTYTSSTAGTFSITATGDGTTVTAPSSRSAPGSGPSPATRPFRMGRRSDDAAPVRLVSRRRSASVANTLPIHQCPLSALGCHAFDENHLSHVGTCPRGFHSRRQ